MNIVQIALSRVDDLPSGTPFSLKDLLSDEEWAEFSKPDRLKSGKKFLKAAKARKDIKPTNNKAGGDDQMYVKN